jgi:hypothetical protein
MTPNPELVAAWFARPTVARDYFAENVADTIGQTEAERIGYGSDDPALVAAWAAYCEADVRQNGAAQ